MSTRNQDISDSDLLAYVDNQLDAERRETVETWLEDHPEKAEEMAGWQAQNEAIHALFASTAGEAVPERLSVRALAASIRMQRRNTWRMAAAAAVLIVIGAGLGYGFGALRPSTDQTDQLIADAITAHELYSGQRLHPVEVAAAEQAHLTTWLSNSLRRPLVAPDLNALGYQLVGGRLLPSGTMPAAQIMYETLSGNRITLYITARRPGDLGDNMLESADGISALYWATDTITCTIIGNLSADEMKGIAAVVFPALSSASTRIDPGYRLG